MQGVRTYDECYFVNYDNCNDLQLYEIGKQDCPPSYSYGPLIRPHYIFHYLFSGKGTLYLNGKEFAISAHEGFLIPPNVLAYYEADALDPWNYAWVHFDGPKTMELLQLAGLSEEHPVFTPDLVPNEIGALMTSLLANNKRELFCIGTLYELFDLIISISTTRSTIKVDRQLSYIKKIINYISIKYSDPIHMDDIAHACGLERSYMTRLFKDATGRTPQEYLTSHRMKRACHMLIHDTLPIRTIAYAVGYGDAFTFSKAFKRQYGISPNEYRNRYKG